MHVARIRYDLNKIKDRMIEFENFKKKGTQEFKALQGQHDRLNELYIEADGIFNRKMLVSEQRLNDSTIAKKNSFKPVYAYDGPVHIIKFDPYTKKPIKTIKIEQGKTYEYKAGDMIVKNPVQYEALESNEQKILRGQSRAFAGRLRGLSANDAKLVYGRYINYLEASKNIRANFNTSSEFTSKDSRSSMYEANTYEMLQEIVHLNENMGSKHALQFLRHMMAPNIKRNTWGVWSANNEQMVKSSVFSKNFNEISVINFLDKARRGEFSEISRDLATEWSTHILNESKKGWAIEFDPRVKKEFKAGNFVEFESFEEARSPILGKNKIAPGRNKPEFLTAEGINEHARDIMTGYLTGENILNPIEVYRLTTAMNNKPLAESRQAHAIHSALWRGVEKKSVGVNGLFESAGTTFTESSRLGVENLKESKTAAESIEKQLFDCR